jgi:benzil reductase ((S)-benzoin forming)
MNYIITGVSRGIGKALAEEFLSSGSGVIGIGRKHDIDHPNFSFVQCDLSVPSEVERLKVSIPKGAVTLINNAGVLGVIKRLTEQDPPDVERVLKINTVAPVLLTNLIYNSVSDKNSFCLINISSGAANRAIPSWASYCASKAALNMFSEAFYLEEKEKGFSPKVYAVAPGVVDTEMQQEIRNTSDADFSSAHKFVDLKRNNDLFTSEVVAKKLIQLINRPYDGQVFFDLRTMNS